MCDVGGALEGFWLGTQGWAIGPGERADNFLKKKSIYFKVALWFYQKLARNCCAFISRLQFLCCGVRGTLEEFNFHGNVFLLVHAALCLLF